MAIQFRCHHCNQLLSISTRKAGLTTVCPACLEELQVPAEAEEGEIPVAAPVVEPAETAVLSVVDRSADRPVDRPAEEFRSPGRPKDDDDDDDEDWNPATRKKAENDAIDMTAMVDVTILLLIFFMVTASFAAQKVMETSRPQEEQEEEGSGGGAVSSVASIDELSESSVVIDIDDHDRITIEGQAVDGMFALREVLSRKLLTEQKTEVLIQAHYNALHGTVVSVTDMAMDVGMQRVRRVSRREGP